MIQIIGVIIILLPFILFFIFMWKEEGLLVALGIYGAVLIIIATIKFGATLAGIK